METNLFCRICGFEHPEPPWGEDGQSPDYAFCPCCGVEAGYQDFTVEASRRYRQSWLDKGARWDWGHKPPQWDLAHQLENIPLRFR